MMNMVFGIDGLKILKEFVDEDLAGRLTEVIHADEDVEIKKGSFGITHVGGFLLVGDSEEALPAPIVELMDLAEPIMGRPHSVISSTYEAGARLTQHMDPINWSGTICSLNLESPFDFTFENHHTAESKTFVVDPRSMVVMGGAARSVWTHGIDFMDEPRIAVVMRRTAN